MREIELELPRAWLSDAGLAADLLESACLALSLRITLKTTLRSFSGCTHWHFKPVGAKNAGTLELTWWPAQQRAWLKIALSRAGGWQAPVIDALHERLRLATSSGVAAPDRQGSAA